MTPVAWVVAIVLGAFSAVVLAYAKRIGENAATKADIEEITDKIEAVKTKYGAELESVKSSLARIGHVHKVQVELEIKAYQDIWAEIVHLDMAIRGLPPTPQDAYSSDFESAASTAAAVDRSRHANRSYFEAIKHSKPFYSPEVYEALDAVGIAARRATKDYAYFMLNAPQAPESGTLYGETGAVLDAIEQACNAIRNRLAALTV